MRGHGRSDLSGRALPLSAGADSHSPAFSGATIRWMICYSGYPSSSLVGGRSVALLWIATAWAYVRVASGPAPKGTETGALFVSWTSSEPASWLIPNHRIARPAGEPVPFSTPFETRRGGLGLPFHRYLGSPL